METKEETFMGGDPGWIRTSDLQLRRKALSGHRGSPFLT